MTDKPLEPVIIGAREIYDAVLALRGSVDRVVEQHAETRSDVKDHENRIRALEAARWPLPALAIVLSLFTLMIAIIPKFID